MLFGENIFDNFKEMTIKIISFHCCFSHYRTVIYSQFSKIVVNQHLALVQVYGTTLICFKNAALQTASAKKLNSSINLNVL